MTKANPASPKYRSDIAAAMHETVRGMHRLGLVDKQTMREFDLTCLTTVDELTPGDIVALREKARVSQSVFALALNVSTDYVSKIERGAKRPRGSTLKLLSLMRRKGFEAIL